MIRINQLKLPIAYSSEQLKTGIAKKLSIKTSDILSFEIVRESIDARRKNNVFMLLSVNISVQNEASVYKHYQKQNKNDPNVMLVNPQKYKFPQCGNVQMEQRPVIIGMGPAGLFCAYYLALRGFKPIVIERGQCVEERQKAVDEFWNTGILNPESNVQFGEGGAGTFSDGKLNTLTKDKSGRNKEVLSLFVKMGAKPSILYEQKPHIGTDILSRIVVNIRNEIMRLGGEVRFQTKVTNLIINHNCICGVKLSDQTEILTKHVVLAIGHSARDTFRMLYDNKINMDSKSFAVGFRVQHSQDYINETQYGSFKEKLNAAPYKVTAKARDDRGVYSFCMCPGGYVVNASSEAGLLAVNGMSYSMRDGVNANSAIIVSVSKEDYPGDGPLAGIEFQRMLEKNAYDLCKGKIPVQLYGDFKENQSSTKEGNISVEVKGLYEFSNLRGIMPENLNQAFIDGMEQIGTKIPGFNAYDVVMAGIESRTSSPVRIHRDDRLMSNVKGLYPCGEGAGYAGGITSAAADGIFVAEEITKTYYLKNTI